MHNAFDVYRTTDHDGDAVYVEESVEHGTAAFVATCEHGAESTGYDVGAWLTAAQCRELAEVLISLAEESEK